MIMKNATNRRLIAVVAAAALTAAAGYALLSGAAQSQYARLFSKWKTDFKIKSVNLSEIISGGVPKDGIPAIDKPKFKPIKEITALGENEPVISFALAGDARAYPLRLLMRHEIVNDVVKGKPVAVTYCPLCNSAVVFDRTIKGKTYDFGVSGNLRNSDMVMYDRQTESWWQQFLGEAIVGKMTGTKLKILPSRVEAWRLFKQRYPQGRVLVPVFGSLDRYGNPYYKYDTNQQPFLFRGELPKYINPMVRVVAFRIDGKPHGVALGLIARQGKYQVSNVVLTWTRGQNSALDTSDIRKGRDIGNVTVQQKGANGLMDIPYDVTFAFVFHAFHPKIKIVQK
jgi:hypothetical protein